MSQLPIGRSRFRGAPSLQLISTKGFERVPSGFRDQKDDEKLTVCGSWEAGGVGFSGNRGFGPNPSFGRRETFDRGGSNLTESRDVQVEFPKTSTDIGLG